MFILSNMQISSKGIDFIASFEGFVGHAYNATGKEQYLTIGYGHYGSDVKAGQTITQEGAKALLLKDLKRYVDGVNSALKVTVNQNQFDAMVSLCYNIGIGAFQSSTLCKLVNAKDFAGASKQFALWNKGGGVVLKGLVNRRSAETKVFNTAVAVAKPAPAPKPVAKPAPKPVATTEKYTVKSGDNLTFLAKKYSTTIANLVSMNKLRNSNDIKIGQVLTVPKKVDSVYGTLTVVCTALNIHDSANLTSAVKKVAEHGDKFTVYGVKNGLYILGGDLYVSSSEKYVHFVKNPNFGK